MEGIAHSGVFFLVGEAQLGVALGALDELDAELGLVRDEGCSSGDAADALFGGGFSFGLGHGGLRLAVSLERIGCLRIRERINDAWGESCYAAQSFDTSG